MSTRRKEEITAWQPFTQMKTEPLPLSVVRAQGASLYTACGREIIDGISSWWLNLHGHSHPHIVQRLKEQADKFQQVIFAGFTHEPAEELSKRLLSVLPSNQSKVFFSDNGSTAVEVALKMAVQYWHNKGERKNKIVALKNAYHGDTVGAMSLSVRGVFSAPFSELLFDVHHIEAPYAGCEDRSCVELEELLKTGEVAAFIYEPLVQGASGMQMYSGKALNSLLELCKEHNAFTIADEVMTGFGRTGYLFASQAAACSPDIMCLSKSLTAGFMPLAVTTATQEIFNVFWEDERSKMFLHGHSFTANALSTAVACASLDLVEDAAFMINVERISAAHEKFLEELMQYPWATRVRQQGTILAFDVQSEESTGYTHSMRDALCAGFLAENVLLRPLGNVVYTLPPFCTSDAQLEQIYAAIRNVVSSL